MEQRDLHVVAAADVHHVLLRREQLPRRGQSAAVLGGVRVADHHLLPARGELPVGRHREQPIQRGRRAVQVGHRLEQRHDGPRRAHAELLLQHRDGQHVGRATRHGDHVRAEGIGGLAGRHAERLQHVAPGTGRGEAVRHDALAGPERALQERDPLLLVPLRERRTTRVPVDLVEDVGVARGLLAEVQPDQAQPEAGQLSPYVREATVRDAVLVRLPQRGVAQPQHVGDLVRVPEEGSGRLLAAQHRLQSGPRVPQPVAHLAEDHAVGLALTARPLEERRRRIAQGQLLAERPDLLLQQVGRHPPRQPADLLRHLGRDVGVAVAVAAHPRPEADRGGLRRQAPAREPAQRPVQPPEVERDRPPQRLLDDDEAPRRLVDGRRPVAAQFVRLPERVDLTRQIRFQVLALRQREVVAVPARQAVGDAAELLEQRAAQHLGGMRGEDQLHLLPGDRLMQLVGRDAVRQQRRERVLERGALRRRLRIALVLAAPADAVVLLGDVGQVQEVRERAGDRQRLVQRHPAEEVREGAERGGITRPPLLRQGAHALHALEDAIARLLADRVAQQAAQVADVPAEARVRISGFGGHAGTLHDAVVVVCRDRSC